MKWVFSYIVSWIQLNSTMLNENLTCLKYRVGCQSNNGQKCCWPFVINRSFCNAPYIKIYLLIGLKYSNESDITASKPSTPCTSSSNYVYCYIIVAPESRMISFCIMITFCTNAHSESPKNDSFFGYFTFSKQNRLRPINIVGTIKSHAIMSEVHTSLPNQKNIRNIFFHTQPYEHFHTYSLKEFSLSFSTSHSLFENCCLLFRYAQFIQFEQKKWCACVSSEWKCAPDEILSKHLNERW